MRAPRNPALMKFGDARRQQLNRSGRRKRKCRATPKDDAAKSREVASIRLAAGLDRDGQQNGRPARHDDEAPAVDHFILVPSSA